MDTIDEKWVEPFQEEDFATLFQSDTFAGFGEEYELQSNNHVLQATPHAAPDAGFCFNDVVHSQPISPTIPPSANLVTDTPPAGNSASDNDTNPHLLANDRFDKVNNDEEDHAENEEEEKPGYTRKAAAKKTTTVRKETKNGKGIKNKIRTDSEAGLQVCTGGLWRPAIFHLRNLRQRTSSTRLGGKCGDQIGEDLLELHHDRANSSEDDTSLFLAQNTSSLSVPEVSTAVVRKPESISQSFESYIDTSTDEGFMYAPAHGTDSNLDPNDCRFHVTHSDNDQLQLLWALHPTIKQFLEALDRQTIEIDLTGSYKLAWDKMQSIFGQHTYERQIDPQFEPPLLLTRFKAWTGGIGNFDLGVMKNPVLTYLGGPFITEARNKTKGMIFRCLTTERLKEKALEVRALSAEGLWLDAPLGVRIQLIDGQLTISDFRLGPRVGRDSKKDEPTV